MKKICIFIGANNGNNLNYENCIMLLTKKMHEHGFELVYGGAQCGLMGKLADSFLELGGSVIGVIPVSMTGQEIVHTKLSKLHIVESIQERKIMMMHLSDAFIAFPGGLGTLEEVFELWNAIKLGLIKKPFGILNIGGYFDALFKFLTHAVNEKFITAEQYGLVTLRDDPITLIDEIVKRFALEE